MARDEGENRSPGRFIQGLSVAIVVLRHRKWRRNLIFGLTVLTLVLVFGGVVILGDRLMNRPMAFLVFWGLCFLLVGLVLILAVFDMLQIRREHRARMLELEQELAGAAEEARRMAEAEAGVEEPGGRRNESGDSRPAPKT